MPETKKWYFTFLDKKGLRAKLTAEIKEENDKKRFSMSGSIAGHFGQCQDNIEPANYDQTELLNLWERYHLNDMHAGTVKQEKALKEWTEKGNKGGYAEKVEYLKSVNLYNDNGYEYGTSWLYNDLPIDLEDVLDKLTKNINSNENDENEDEEKLTKVQKLMKEEGIDEGMENACNAYLSATSASDLSDFEECYQGEFDDDEEFAQNMADNVQCINTDAQWPNNCIDWEKAAKELMYDYIEENGYYFRNC